MMNQVKKNIQYLYSMDTIKDLQMLQTPCFILDLEELERSVKGFYGALTNHFDKVVLGYSVKTNSLPYGLKKAGEWGAYAEVVSFDEYELAKVCGFSPDHIIYNGPMKSKETFLEAVMHNAIVNIETRRELDWLRELPANRMFQVGLRLNINISHISEEDADGDNDNSRFGFSDETDDFRDALQVISRLSNVQLKGLHLHRTSHSRSLQFYRRSISHGCEIIKKYGLNLDYMDIGGGFFGIFPNKPTYQQYSDVIYQTLQRYGMDHLMIVVEPGNALVASCFQFLTEVIDIKHVEKDCWFVTTDGSRNDIDPFFRKSGYFYEILSQNTEKEYVTNQIVSGCTCLEYDRLFSIKDSPLLSVGDRILYKNVGAYTFTLSPMFIRFIPTIYAKEENGYKLIREKWTVEEFIQKSII